MSDLTNPFGLVYDNAITENISGQVNIHPVSYISSGVKISANVYTPAGYDEGKSYPAVTVAHPNGGVKEQVSGMFAQKLAEHGYIAIAADAAYQGASEGTPRNTDHPANRVEDIRAMADYLQTFPGVDTNRIGALGICGGGGYTIEAVKTDKRFKAVATISMFNTGRVRRNGFLDAQLDSIKDRLEQARAARVKRLTTGEVDYIGNHLDGQTHFTQEQLEQIPAGLYRDGAEYYADKYYHPNSQSWYTAESLAYLMAFDAEERAELIDQPLLMIAGKDADTRYMTDAVFEKATGTDQKELYLIDGATHIQTYWKEPFVSQEEAKIVEFFGKYL
ncbi:alpha/beta hydrolase [Streptococcus macacae]|uniref:X-Pro dipeptidyl-peptidase (S15 family) n=1 Tax=Streptococcus macacae NCTC 11558 TaxID=764298 RepID=G5JU07_9STRE|nr:alpha/beta hydrolase [Streptococcus macacae]EHJ52290.1 X-Pro dipeptidyl-peptidase (S15 family) [Streptococcus macacae NCTC 11558]SUN78374.1 Hydrolase of the alpha/beta superfamily-like protein [Streptococcus macacae NCTC 11558]